MRAEDCGTQPTSSAARTPAKVNRSARSTAAGQEENTCLLEMFLAGALNHLKDQPMTVETLKKKALSASIFHWQGEKLMAS